MTVYYHRTYRSLPNVERWVEETAVFFFFFRNGLEELKIDLNVSGVRVSSVFGSEEINIA